ncbi:MAG: hypothetical protein ACI9SC_000812 [Gammaproteobacteria bacterium]|jgi:hypothetical protein
MMSDIDPKSIKIPSNNTVGDRDDTHPPHR